VHIMRFKLLAFIVAVAVLMVALHLVHIGTCNDMWTGENKIEPNIRELKLITGTPGDKIRIVYYGEYDIPISYDSAIVDVDLGEPSHGLEPTVAKTTTEVRESQFCVRVVITASGSYSGGDFDWEPVKKIVVKFYANGTEVGELTLKPDPATIRVTEVKVKIENVKIIKDRIVYHVKPENPHPGDTIIIYPSGAMTADIILSDTPTVPVDAVFKYKQPGVGTREETVTLSGTKTTVQIDDVNLWYMVEYSLTVGSLTVATGSIKPPKTGISSLGCAIFSVSPPLILWKVDDKSYHASVIVSVSSIRGELTVTVRKEGGGPGTSETFTDAGTKELDLRLGKENKVELVYDITFKSPEGSIVSLTMTGKAEAVRLGVGVISIIYMSLFSLYMAAAFGLIFLGLLLRNPNLQQAGLMAAAAAFMVFIVPTIIAYSVNLLSLVVGPLPIDLRNLNVINLGQKVEEAIRYIQAVASRLVIRLSFNISLALGILSILTGLAAGGGLLGLILTGGGLSQFLGRVLGTLGSYIISFAVLGYVVGIVLSVMASIYPIIIVVVLVLLYALAVFHTIKAIFTGDITPLFQTVISISTVILIVLAAPAILNLFEHKIAERTVLTIPVGPGIEIPSLPDYFAYATLEAIILGAILYMAFNRLISALSL